MKKNTLLLIFFLFLAFQLVLGGFCWIALPNAQDSPLDNLAVNETVQTAALHWDALERGELPVREDSTLHFTVLSRDGRVLAATAPGLSASLTEAIAAGDVMVDVERNGQVLGKLLFASGRAEQLQAMRSSLLLFLLVCGGAELFLLGGFLLLADRHIFRPFRQLRLFAGRVAEGNLEMPLKMDRGNLFGAFTESFDLMREELRNAQERERAADRSKKELVAKLSHDIKTPVASIEAVSELMEVSATTEKERARLAVIREKAQQIDRLISDLFHATLEELQELPVAPSEQSSLCLPQLIAAADYLNRAAVEPVPACMLLFDRARLQQVLDNVLSNSYKYADTPLQISFVLDGTRLLLRIQDFGPGVDSEELPLLCEKFRRGKNAQGKSGAGLGLFISRYLLTKMGGGLTCRNESNGFCAEIFLPLAGN